MLAAYKVRAVPINVNFRYVAEELRYLFNDADLVGVLYQPDYAERLAEVATETPRLGWSLATGADYEDALAASSPERDFAARSGDDHYVLYTGGTTGMPKGVLWRQEDAFFACMGGGDPSRPEITSVQRAGRAHRAGTDHVLDAGAAHARGRMLDGHDLPAEREPNRAVDGTTRSGRGLAHHGSRVGHRHQCSGRRGAQAPARCVGRLRPQARSALPAPLQLRGRAALAGRARTVPGHVPHDPPLGRLRLVGDRDTGRPGVRRPHRRRARAAVRGAPGGRDGRGDPRARAARLDDGGPRGPHRSHPAGVLQRSGEVGRHVRRVGRTALVTHGRHGHGGGRRDHLVARSRFDLHQHRG